MTDNPFDVGYVAPEHVDAPERVADVPQPFAAGIQRLSSAEYHADPAPEPSLSATLAKLIVGKSPLHAWFASPRLNPNRVQIDKKTFDIGRAAHRAVLGEGDDYVAIPDELLSADGKATTKAAKDFVAEARASNRVPLKQSEVDQVNAMGEVARHRLAERGIILDPSRSELAAVAQIDGVWCRAMFDNVPADPKLPIWDFKTCEDASPAACLRRVERLRTAGAIRKTVTSTPLTTTFSPSARPVPGPAITPVCRSARSTPSPAPTVAIASRSCGDNCVTR